MNEINSLEKSVDDKRTEYLKLYENMIKSAADNKNPIDMKVKILLNYLSKYNSCDEQEITIFKLLDLTIEQNKHDYKLCIQQIMNVLKLTYDKYLGKKSDKLIEHIVFTLVIIICNTKQNSSDIYELISEISNDQLKIDILPHIVYEITIYFSYIDGYGTIKKIEKLYQNDITDIVIDGIQQATYPADKKLDVLMKYCKWNVYPYSNSLDYIFKVFKNNKCGFEYAVSCSEKIYRERFSRSMYDDQMLRCILNDNITEKGYIVLKICDYVNDINLHNHDKINKLTMFGNNFNQQNVKSTINYKILNC
jgi:hypothetical protein